MRITKATCSQSRSAFLAVLPGSDALPTPGGVTAAHRKAALHGPDKPTAAELGAGDPLALSWRRSGEGPGGMQVAFARASGMDWVLLRVEGDEAGLVSVYSRHEWECFLDGARKGEFDGLAELRVAHEDVRQAPGER